MTERESIAAMTPSEKLAVIIERQGNIIDDIADIKNKQDALSAKFDFHAESDSARFSSLEKFNAKAALLGVLALVLLTSATSLIPKIILGDGTERLNSIVKEIQKSYELQDRRMDDLIKVVRKR